MSLVWLRIGRRPCHALVVELVSHAATRVVRLVVAGASLPLVALRRINESNEQCKLDALHTLYNIPSETANIPHLLSARIIDALGAVITEERWRENCIAVLIYFSSSKSARDEITGAPRLIRALTNVLDVGEPMKQEQAAAYLLTLDMVLQEGVIPSLVSISVNGTMRGKQKAQKLLMLFREQRQQDPPGTCNDLVVENQRPLSKSVSRRKVGKAFSFWRKNKSFSVYHMC
ncbi:U-box domain-containing family protein [Striga asiatica]|uniref:U-box domain-containing family protein n=1 Tax=Striga asiatica TaxID=4170 RepID=A0A5A7QSG5_STRAF|nr:U-box domain-containing family protein [Striga asiatica]